MRTIWTIIAIVLVVGAGIWFLSRGKNNPGVPTTGGENSSTTDSLNGNYMNSSSTNPSYDNSKG